MLSIALSEFRMLLRNRLVAACAILIPLGFGVFFLATAGSRGAAMIAVLQVVVMVAMGVYITATTTLAARRQTLFLKRLRSGAVSDRSIIGGLVLPIVVVSVVQVAIVLTILGFTAAEPPQNVALVILAVLLAEVMFAGFALATAGLTNSPEHAQVTTLPLFFITAGVAVWVTLTGTADLAVVKRLLPGGGIAELMIAGWSGAGSTNLFSLVAPSLAWAVLSILAAQRMFRWEPRA